MALFKKASEYQQKTLFVKRNSKGRITGVYREPKPGKAEEELPHNHPSIEDYKKRNKALLANPSPDPEAEIVRLRSRLERLQSQVATQKAQKHARKAVN